jgi:uncharacterized protein (TIGR03000 family)
VVAVLAAAALVLGAGAGPARAQFSYPSGYDPVSGLTWYEDFHSNGGMNPFGLPDGQRAWPATPNSYSRAPAYVPIRSGGFDYSYGAYSRPAPDNTAHIRVVVPPDARVWFGSEATKESGRERLFESPELRPGREYTYVVKAQWKENGKEVTRTRNVDVRANSFTTVDFNRPAR